MLTATIVGALVGAVYMYGLDKTLDGALARLKGGRDD